MQLLKRLNSYSKQHPLYRGLKEFGKGPKSEFILKYIDDMEFRQAIEKQLNKVESSNKFSRAVSYGHNQEIIQSEKEDQEIAEACRRLIKNAIICWNYLYLARELERQPDEAHREALLDAIRNGSVGTYGHFNLHGEFDFSPERMVDSVGLWTPRPRSSTKPANNPACPAAAAGIAKRPRVSNTPMAQDAEVVRRVILRAAYIS